MGLPLGGVLADVGCGNGKYFGVRSDMTILASDRSFGLAAQASRRCHSANHNWLSDGSSDPAARNNPPENLDTAIGRGGCDYQEDLNTIRARRASANDDDRLYISSATEHSGCLETEPVSESILNRHQGRSHAYHADVLVADGLQLPYRVSSVELEFGLTQWMGDLHPKSSLGRISFSF